MRRWSELADRVAGTSRTSEKTALLADYFRTLPSEDLPIAAVFLTGRPFPEADQRATGIGWAAMATAVTDVAGVDRAQLGDPEREDAMAWMGHPVPVNAMVGMQSPADIDRLAGPADEQARSELFLELMIDHHRGAVHMAEYAAEHATTAKVRDFALVTAANQAKEIREYELALEGLRA